VRIEASYHQKLVALKMLRHKSMSEAIHEALDHYFADVLPDAPRVAPPPAAPSHVAPPHPGGSPARSAAHAHPDPDGHNGEA